MDEWIDIKKEQPTEKNKTIKLKTTKGECVAQWFFNWHMPLDLLWIEQKDVTHWKPYAI
jgi:hypothetical protein